MSQNVKFSNSSVNRRKTFRALIIMALSLAMVIGLIGCGSNNITNQLPKEFILEYIAKQETMVDPSLVYYYVREEQENIAEQVDTTIRIKKAEGTLESFKQANFDFSDLEMKVIDQKEKFVNDEAVIFLKVAVKGDLCINLPTEQQTVACDDIIIISMHRNEWKVSQTNNPWI